MKNHLADISTRSRISLFISSLIMFSFFGVQTGILLGCLEISYQLVLWGYFSGIAFMLLFLLVVFEFLGVKKKIKEDLKNKISDLESIESFVNEASIISKADSKGLIVYVNKKFEEVSGWKIEEVIGKDHSIVNSGVHPKHFWTNMYKTVIKDRRVWNAICTNRTKNGELYYI